MKINKEKFLIILTKVLFSMLLLALVFYSGKYVEQKNCKSSTSGLSEENLYKDFQTNYLKVRENESEVNQYFLLLDDPTNISLVSLTPSGDVVLYFEPGKLKKKYGESYKVMSDIVSVHVGNIGQDGMNHIVAIKKDGSLARVDAYKLFDNQIEISDDCGIGTTKNIVDVRNFTFYWPDEGGYTGMEAIDIKGNHYPLVLPDK